MCVVKSIAMTSFSMCLLNVSVANLSVTTRLNINSRINEEGNE